MKAGGLVAVKPLHPFRRRKSGALLKCEHMSLRYCIPAARTQCPQAGRPSNSQSFCSRRSFADEKKLQLPATRKLHQLQANLDLNIGNDDCGQT